MSNQNQKEVEAFFQSIAKKANDDSQYKERLIKDPISTIKEDYPNFQIEGNIKVNDQTDPNTLFLTLYSETNHELSEEELENVAGGEGWSSKCDYTVSTGIKYDHNGWGGNVGVSIKF